jgi:hypothetical protein
MRKLSSILVVVFALVVALSSVGMAGDMAGTVTGVNAEKGTLTLQSTDGKTVELQASAEMLADLQAGDVIQVSTSGNKATEIKKQGGQ